MKLILDIPKGGYQIQSYTPGHLTINNKIYTHSVVVAKNTLLDWEPQSLAELNSLHFQAIADQKPEVVILGTGEHLEFPPASIFELLINKNIGFEIMNTAAACRTFNVLIAEERKAIAALLL